METSLKTDFAQIFSRCPKNLSCPKFGRAAAPLGPPARTPMTKSHACLYPFDTPIKSLYFRSFVVSGLFARFHFKVIRKSF